MSGTRVFTTVGAAATAVDMQRLCDVAAQSEDHVWDMLLTPQWSGSGVYNKRVFPFVPEPGLSPYVHPRMVYPGTITGGVDILPAHYVIGTAGNVSANANVSTFSASGRVDPNTLLPSLFSFPADTFPTTVTNGRLALVYAVVKSVVTSGSRKYKDPDTGAVTTQSVQLYSSPTVSFAVILGPTDGTMTVDDVPADTGDTWYFRLAFLVLGGVGVPWVQGTAITQDLISQAWDGGWISRNRVQLAEAASITGTWSAGVNGAATTPLSSRWGATIATQAVLQHETDGTGSYVTIDNTHDWSRRMIRVTFMSIIGDPTNTGSQGTTPDSTSTPPLQADPNTIVPFIGASFTPAVPLPGYLTPRLRVIRIPLDSTNKLDLFVHDNGSLQAEFKGTPFDYNGTKPRYLLLVEASDQFLL